MSAALVGITFGATLALAGGALGRWLAPSGNSRALGAAAAFAVAALTCVNVATLWRFHPGAALIPGAGLAAWTLAASWRDRRHARAGRSGAAPPAGVLALVTLASLAPLLVLPVPLDTDAQGFGMLALAIREGGTIHTLAPWRPDIEYLYAPGALAVFATVSALASPADLPAVMMGVSHASVVLFVWLAWSFGHEIGTSFASRPGEAAGGFAASDGWAWATSIAAALSVGLWTALLDAHYTAVFGLWLTLAFLTAFAGYVRSGRRRLLVTAAMTLAAVPVVHADSAMILAFGVAAMAGVGWIVLPPPERRRWIVGLPVAVALAVSFAAPWLLSLSPLIQSGIASPYESSLSHLRQAVLYHGIVWPVLSIAGAIVWMKRGSPWPLVMVLWCLIALETSVLGWSSVMSSGIADTLLRFNYPFSVAWHAPVIPYMTLGAGTLVWVLRRRARAVPRAPRPRLVVAAALCLPLGVAAAPALLSASRSIAPFHGAFATSNDLEAMRWIRTSTPADARVLNYPGDYEARRDWEAHWAPVVTERDCVYFRMQPFFLSTHPEGDGLARAFAEQRDLLAFWRDPARPEHAARLSASGIDYVLVPESVGDPATLARAWRWQPPALLEPARSRVGDAAYLELVFAKGAARVYRVNPAFTVVPRHSP